MKMNFFIREKISVSLGEFFEKKTPLKVEKKKLKNIIKMNLKGQDFEYGVFNIEKDENHVMENIFETIGFHMLIPNYNRRPYVFKGFKVKLMHF